MAFGQPDKVIFIITIGLMVLGAFALFMSSSFWLTIIGYLLILISLVFLVITHSWRWLIWPLYWFDKGPPDMKSDKVNFTEEENNK